LQFWDDTQPTIRMKSAKTYIIILIVQFVLMAMFLIYALVQRTQAIKQRELATSSEQKAIENESKAMMAIQEASKQAEIAREQRTIAERLLKECQSK
jgi:hypothetical protein